MLKECIAFSTDIVIIFIAFLHHGDFLFEFVKHLIFLCICSSDLFLERIFACKQDALHRLANEVKASFESLLITVDICDL